MQKAPESDGLPGRYQGARLGGHTKKLAVVFHGLPIQGVQHGVSCPVSCTGASVGLASLSKVEGLAAEGSLVDFAVFCPREWQAIVFELPHRCRRFSAHVLYRILQYMADLSAHTISLMCRHLTPAQHGRMRW